MPSSNLKLDASERMPRIKTKELLDRIAAGDFISVKVKGVQNGIFHMMLECEDGIFIHENLDGRMKEYKRVDDALHWLKRKTEVKKVIIDIELWKNDDPLMMLEKG